jgi:hypothetical protein
MIVLVLLLGCSLQAKAYVLSGTKWPQPSIPGYPITLTYSYSNLLDGVLGLSTSDLRSAVEESLSLWAGYAPLNFVEVFDSGPMPTSADTPYQAGDHPVLRFGHHYMDGAYYVDVYGNKRNSILAHANYPAYGSGLAGDVHMDSSEPWSLGGEEGFNFLYVFTHELGHALGLAHEPMPADGGAEAVMNPRYFADRFGGLGTAMLFSDDIAGIQALYGIGVGSVTPLPEPATLLLLVCGSILLKKKR